MDNTQTPLLKKVHEQVQLNESGKKKKFDHLRDPKRVIGLHDASHIAYQDYIDGLDPEDPYDLKILQRIASGN